MDGVEGEAHPEWAYNFFMRRGWKEEAEFCLYHSRFYCKKNKTEPSKLCFADKLASAIYPVWLYGLLGGLSGEIKEFCLAPKHELCDGRVMGAREFLFKYRGIVREVLRAVPGECQEFAEKRWTLEHTPFGGKLNA